MTRLIFDAAEVRRIAMHSIANPQREIADWSTANKTNNWTPARSVPAEPTVVLVHDQGVYLMSNAKVAEGTTPLKEKLVVYAEGCDPDKDEDWYYTARALVGGDDFADYLPWAQQLLVMADSGAKQIVLNLRGDKITLEGLYRATPK